MHGHDIIAVGASAGGIEVLSDVIGRLPSDLPAALFVVVHISSSRKSRLPEILTRAGALTASHVTGSEPIEHGRIYIAPPDRHLLVRRGAVHAWWGPMENGFRPAVDPLFRSAAQAYRSRVVGVVLSGELHDGTFGLDQIKRYGGIAVIQDPTEAPFAGMPASALGRVSDVDHVLPRSDIAPLLVRLAHEHVEEGSASAQVLYEGEMPEGVPGPPAALTCPDCGGALLELGHVQVGGFRCHVGHRFSELGLLDAQTHALESALWSALRVLEEKASLLRGMSARMRHKGGSRLTERLDGQARDLEENARILRQRFLSGSVSAEETAAPRDVGEKQEG